MDKYTVPPLFMRLTVKHKTDLMPWSRNKKLYSPIFTNNGNTLMVTSLVFHFHSRRSRPPSWAVTSQQTTNTLWQDPVTRRPPSTRSSTRKEAPALLQHFYWDDLCFPPRPSICGLQQTETNYRSGKLLWQKSMEMLAWGCLCWKEEVNLSFFYPFFFFWRVYFWVTLFFFSCFPWENLGVTRWSGASFLRTSFPRRLVKSVHIELNKRHFIYIL